MEAKHWLILVLSFAWAKAQQVTYLAPGEKSFFASPNYPNKYSAGSSFSKGFTTSVGNTLNLVCLAQVPSPDGLKIKLDAATFTSGGYFIYTSTGTARGEWNSKANELAVGLDVAANTAGGSLNCLVTALGGLPATSLNVTCGRRATSSGSRIINGTKVPVNEIPWQVRLITTTPEGSFLCGGSIIAPDWILTAAHCVENGISTEVTAGQYDVNTLSVDQQVAQASRIISHELYNSTTVDNDIALLQLSTPLKYSNAVRPVCLPYGIKAKVFNGEVGTVSGWGRTTPEGVTSDILLKISIPIYDTAACQKFSAPGYSTVNNNMICTYQKGSDTCKGDSGGPLTWERSCNGRTYLIGAVSYHFGGCAIPEAPAVYSKVSQYLNWIESKTGAIFDRY